MSGYRRRQDKKRLYKGLGIAAAVLIVGIVFVALVLGMADHYRFNNDNSVDSRDTITYKDQTYTRKGNIETYLITGIDSPGKVQELKEYDGTGQCDVLVVIVRDRSTDECKLLTIDRNTITEVKSLDDDGTCLATTDIQISLAHSDGTGSESACREYGRCGVTFAGRCHDRWDMRWSMWELFRL